MELFGTSRSRVGRMHALIAPDSFVRSDLPGWERSPITSGWLTAGVTRA